MTATATLSHPHARRNLVGRDVELEQLRALLAADASERGRLVLIGGEAGIGKSALVEAFTSEARERGVQILTGACYDLAIAPPYGPWIEITTAWAAAGWQPELPAFVGDQQALEALAGTDALHEELGAFFERVAQNTPLAIVLEDLHWADQASLELLRYLVRRLPGTPVTILATYRDVDLAPGDPLYRLLPQLVRESRALRVMPRRLAPGDVELLVQRRYKLKGSDQLRLVDWLDRFAEGNPFYIEELLYTLEHELVLRTENGGWALGDLATVRMPALVRQVIDERLAWLDADSLRLIQVAAVIGAEAPVDLWSEVAEASDDALADAIEAAQRVRLLEEARDRNGFRFRHALIREALYNSLVLPRRRGWHRRVADVLSAHADPDADAVAYHFQQAGDPRAVIWLVRAGERAARNYAWRMAVERLQAALDLLGTGPEEDLKRALLLYHTGMLARRSDIADGVRRLEECLRLAKRLDNPRLIGLATADLGLVHCISGRIAQGTDEIWAGIKLLEESGVSSEPNFLGVPDDLAEFALPTLLPDPGTRAGPALNWMSAAGRLSEVITVGSDYVKRIAAYPRHQRYQTAYDAYIGLGHAWIMLGKPDEARAALDAAATGYVDIAQMPWLYFLNEIGYTTIFRLDRPMERDRLMRLLQDIWDRSTAATARVPRGQSPTGSIRLQFLLGDWDVVEDWTRTATGQATLGLGRLAAIRLQGVLARLRGDTALAWEQIEAAQRDSNLLTFGDTWMLTANGIHELAADLALDAGNLPLAMTWIDLLGDWLDQSGAVIGRVEHALLRARHAELSGDLTAAQHLAREALAHAVEPRQPLSLQRAQRAVARHELLAGRLSEAEELLRATLALALDCSTPFERAQAQLLIAELQLAMRDLTAARAALDDARDVATRLRALPTLARVDELDARLASIERPATTSVAGLSERELDVLRLVARGMTDADVAAALFISPRTVSGHLQSIYNKLGISSRTAATAFAYERGLV